MTKSERNAKIIEMTKNGKTNAEIISAIKAIDKDMPVSDDTIRKVRKDAGLEYKPTSGFAAPPAFSVEELYKMIVALQDELTDLKDDLAISYAKIDKLESNIVSCNELKSSKKYIVKRYTTKEFIAYADEFDLGKYIKIFNVVPITTIENSINNIGQWIDRPDDIIITYTVENHIDKLNEHMEDISDEHNTMKRTIREIVE